MSKLYLHVGHGKTGSSFLQSIFALSSKNFEDVNLVYPEVKNSERAAQGKITSGNGAFLLEFLNSGVISKSDNTINYLFSSEILFHDFLTSDSKNILNKLNALNVESIEVLLFIRDPIDHASSSYQQSIKRGGGTKSVDDFFDSYAQPKQVCDFISKLSAIDNVNITIKNYSKCKDDLVEVTSNWLNIDANLFELPGIKKVNRSLTRSELYLQKEFNKHFGRSGHLVADPLCEILPDIEPEPIRPEESVQLRMLHRLQNEMLTVNSFVKEKSDCYSEVIFNTLKHVENDIRFVKPQVEVFTRAISREIIKAKNKSSELDKSGSLKVIVQKRFQQDAADVFRNMAISFELVGDYDMAYKFMFEASKARPAGKVIKNKLEFYRNILDRS